MYVVAGGLRIASPPDSKQSSSAPVHSQPSGAAEPGARSSACARRHSPTNDFTAYAFTNPPA